MIESLHLKDFLNVYLLRGRDSGCCYILSGPQMKNQFVACKEWEIERGTFDRWMDDDL